MKNFINLFIPILLSNITVILGGVADTIYLSHYSTTHVAAMSVTLSIYALVFILGYGLLQGMMQLLAEAKGRHDLNESQIIIRQGVLMVLLLSIFGAYFLTHAQFFLEILKADSNLQLIILDCLLILAFALPAQLLLRTFFIVTQTCSKAKLVFYANVIALCLKLILSYCLIYGVSKLSIPEMGAKGAVLATLIMQWVILMLYYMVFLDSQYRVRLTRQFFNLNIFIKILRIGFPTAIIILIDVISFTFIALLSIPLGVISLTAHQIVVGICSLMFMFPSSLASAFSILISTKVGEDKLDIAWQLTKNAIWTCFVIAVVVVSCVYGFRTFITPLFTTDPNVTAIVLNLLIILSILHVADALLCVLVNMLRCWYVTLVPMLIYTSLILLLGLGGGWYLAYHPFNFNQFHIPALGIYGFWILLAIAYVLAAITCGLCLRYRQYLK